MTIYSDTAIDNQLFKYNLIRIRVASPTDIKQWYNLSEQHQIQNAKTLNYRNLKPEAGGLFCETIFGSVNDLEKRRAQVGYIELTTPMTHIWFLKGSSCYLGLLLNQSRKTLEKLTYCSHHVSTNTMKLLPISSANVQPILPFRKKNIPQPYHTLGKKHNQFTFLAGTLPKVFHVSSSWVGFNLNGFSSDESCFAVHTMIPHDPSNHGMLPMYSQDFPVLLFMTNTTIQQCFIQSYQQNMWFQRPRRWTKRPVQSPYAPDFVYFFQNYCFKHLIEQQTIFGFYSLPNFTFVSELLTILYGLNAIDPEYQSPDIQTNQPNQGTVPILYSFSIQTLKPLLHCAYAMQPSESHLLLSNSATASINQQSASASASAYRRFKTPHLAQCNCNLLVCDIGKSLEDQYLEPLHACFFQHTKNNQYKPTAKSVVKFGATFVRAASVAQLHPIGSDSGSGSGYYKRKPTAAYAGQRLQNPLGHPRFQTWLVQKSRSSLIKQHWICMIKQSKRMGKLQLNCYQKTYWLHVFLTWFEPNPNRNRNSNVKGKKLAKSIKSNKRFVIETQKVVQCQINWFACLHRWFCYQPFVFMCPIYTPPSSPTIEPNSSAKWKRVGVGVGVGVAKTGTRRQQAIQTVRWQNSVSTTDFQNTLTEFVKNDSIIRNKYYVICYMFLWQQIGDWDFFLDYMARDYRPSDQILPDYFERAMTSSQPFVGSITIHHLLHRLQLDYKVQQKTSGHEVSGCQHMINHFQGELNQVNQNLKTLQTYKFYGSIGKSYTQLANSTHIDLAKQDLMTVILPKMVKVWHQTIRRLRFRRLSYLRRLKILRPFLNQDYKAYWLTLQVLPILPPGLRPVLVMDNNKVAVSDLNKLYQKVILRNKRLKRNFFHTDYTFFSLELRYGIRLLQQSVDALIENGKAGTDPVLGSNQQPLKSLSDMLKGKQGRFRQNLLGKRVDYSGRSVIVVGPQLTISECGLPKQMALELFYPFVIRGLMRKGIRTLIQAKKLIAWKNPVVWVVLHQIMEDHPILLNRAPTLHRLGIQAFKPVMISGRAILLHPLVCSALNADFDGDQMAVHIPLSHQACAEAWQLMWSRNHLLSSATGEPNISPSQDMVLGCYYLTILDKIKRQQHVQQLINAQTKPISQNPDLIVNINQIDGLLETRQLGLHQTIWIKSYGTFEFEEKTHSCFEFQMDCLGNTMALYDHYKYYLSNKSTQRIYFIKTTAGRVIINRHIFENVARGKNN